LSSVACSFTPSNAMCLLSVGYFKDNAHKNTQTHTQNDLKEIIWSAASVISSQELQTVCNNIHQMSSILRAVRSFQIPALTCDKLHYIIQAVNVHSMSRFHFMMDIL
jgi:hypothetical protein